MFGWISDLITNWKWNSIIAIVLYWAPFFFCIFGYTIRTARNYMKDKRELEIYYTRLADWKKTGYYSPSDDEDDRMTHRVQGQPTYYPTDTVGTLIGRGLVSIIPVGNLWAALFDLAPEIFRRFFRWLGKFFDFPLVPGPKKDR